MIRINKINPTVRMLVDYVAHDEMTFDNAIQRGYVWKRDKKSKLISSIVEGYPIPPVYANKINGVYDVVDGKQRFLTIPSYVNNEFSLSALEQIELDNGEKYDLSGKKFCELLPEIQGRILGYNLDLHYAESLTREQVKELFIRLNSGRPLSATEITKAETISIDQVIQLAKHPIFSSVMKEVDREASKNIGFVMQASIILNEDKTVEKCLLNAKMKKVFRSEQLTEKNIEDITLAFDMFERVFNKLLEDRKKNKVLLIILKRKSHFISLLPIMLYAVEHNVSVSTVMSWITHFFGTTIGKTSINEVYNENLVQGINSATAVEARINATTEDFLSYIEGGGVQYV